jgi:osmotically-inducible protein OsmY
MTSPHSFVLSLAAASVLLSGSTSLASDTDDRIESAARGSYVFRTHLKDDSIKADAKDGVVTLTGSVAESSHRSLAEITVEALPGVVRVDNRLTVPKTAPSELSDGWLATKVKSTLLFHRNVRGTATSVEVMDGVVVLTGEATSHAQKDLTTEYACDIEGAKKVVNQMKVTPNSATTDQKPSVEIDDASITAQVRLALMSRRSTSSLNTMISTTKGIVTVTGTARNPAEKSLVTKLISDIHGVQDVINNMTLAAATSSN